MSYDVCEKKWNDGKEHVCVEMEGHGGLCCCVCGAQKRITYEMLTA
jgi:hypothetical protein